jgi:hypothetical protein
LPIKSSRIASTHLGIITLYGYASSFPNNQQNNVVCTMPCQLPSNFQFPMMDQAIWSWDALALKSHMLLNWIPQFNTPMHSIHVDHGIHTILPWMMATKHIVLRPPLPLLSLSPGYLTWTKGSVMPPPNIFLSTTSDRYDAPGPMSNIPMA